ncbi:hypothetical protein [Niveibacterium sp. COAC-50]|uniref:hypothetical protein n=1 Tax=Niveibacterium sp. COAC-50 TaxID=2729384 RepID=UPI0015519A82|nr:hypothetical protein [Niveibacterium sp. COAC-50]
MRTLFTAIAPVFFAASIVGCSPSQDSGGSFAQAAHAKGIDFAKPATLKVTIKTDRTGADLGAFSGLLQSEGFAVTTEVSQSNSQPAEAQSVSGTKTGVFSEGALNALEAKLKPAQNSGITVSTSVTQEQ